MMDHNFHYHIRWEPAQLLDWESFQTSAEAEAAAQLLSRPSETYTIEERDEGCQRCRAALNLKTAPGPDNGSENLNSKLKYPWQQALLDAFVELCPEHLPEKINAAERAIGQRLCDPAPSDSDEQKALREALANLRMIFPTCDSAKKTTAA